MQKDITISWGSFDHGRRTIGTAAEPLSASVVKCERGVLVKSAAANTGTVYVGNSDVTIGGSAEGTDGFELSAGESVFIEVNKVGTIYVVATAVNQNVFWLKV